MKGLKMTEITVDLSNQGYPVFNTNGFSELSLIKTNFIFGKNGTGKSTLVDLITSQYQNDYDIRLFTGMEMYLEDEKLNVVLLGKESKDKKIALESLEQEIKELEDKRTALINKKRSYLWREEYLDLDIERSKEYLRQQDLILEIEKKERRLLDFLTHSASSIKHMSSPQIVLGNYNRNNLRDEIENATQLSPVEIEKLEESLFERPKDILEMEYPELPEIITVLEDIEIVLKKELQKTINISELDENIDKKNFAEEGIKIHKPGDNCAFCGNLFTNKRSKELNTYFSASEVTKLNSEIISLMKILEDYKRNIESIELLDKNSFYKEKELEIIDCNNLIKETKLDLIAFINEVLSLLENKLKDPFSPVNKIDLKIPTGNNLENIISKIISEHNEYTENFTEKSEENRTLLRYHHIHEVLNIKDTYKEDWKGYEIEQFELESLKERLETINNEIAQLIVEIDGDEEQLKPETILYLDNQLREKISERKELIAQTENTEVLVNRVNTILHDAGKKDIKLTLQKIDGIEYYLIKDNENNIRNLNHVSTGEKNIIAFLYFIETLAVRESNIPRIIIFDDPMTSNDDTMQYLIITELQKLYRNMSDKFNPSEDVFVLLTHNVHFYLNLQTPQRNRYRKNNFYWLNNGFFTKISSEKEDINTHYDLLWAELKSLYENDLINSMLNSMRRIVETYIKFTKRHPDDFYKDLDEQRKYFNVNSHSIDDFSAEYIGKNKDELLASFKYLFEKNKALDHFESYWN